MQDGSSSADGTGDYEIEPLSGLETIVKELLQECGYNKIYTSLTNMVPPQFQHEQGYESFVGCRLLLWVKFIVVYC